MLNILRQHLNGCNQCVKESAFTSIVQPHLLTSLSTFDFTLYNTLPHNLIKDKLIDLIERTFQREGSPYLACNDKNAFFTSEQLKIS